MSIHVHNMFNNVMLCMRGYTYGHLKSN